MSGSPIWYMTIVFLAFIVGYAMGYASSENDKTTPGNL